MAERNFQFGKFTGRPSIIRGWKCQCCTLFKGTKTEVWRFKRVSRPLQGPVPFCHYTFRFKYCYQVKKQAKLHWDSKIKREFVNKISRSHLGHSKMAKISQSLQYPHSHVSTFILLSNDSSATKASDENGNENEKRKSHQVALWNGVTM